MTDQLLKQRNCSVSFQVNCPSIYHVSSWLTEQLISIIKTSKRGQIVSIICTHLNTNLDQISIKALDSLVKL